MTAFRLRLSGGCQAVAQCRRETSQGIQRMKKSEYRPDIDGLRAIAVISVVIFHFNNGWLPGGFIGVDIFFVISGFLITGIVCREVVAGNFSFRSFFVRRVRRILPAALFVTLVTLLAGVVFMLPADSRALSESAVATTVSLANVYFWLFLDNRYFAASTDTVPLLHMWSLGVEEQFYLIWPAILLALYKLGGFRSLFFVSVILCAASFIASNNYVKTDFSFAYYMLPARAGELLIGCITYMLVSNVRSTKGIIYSQLLSIAGSLMLIWSFWFIDKESGFPGFISLAPTVGAAMLIASGSIGTSLLGTMLSFKPLVRIGLLSFSLYLWHWPVLAFYRYAYGDITLVGGLVCFLLICMLTIFSYRYIEVPFRSNKVRRIRSPIFAASAGSLVIAFSGIVYSNDGYLSDRYAQKIHSMDELTKPAYSFPYVCQKGQFVQSLFGNKRCIIGPGDKDPSVLIWGDSNAAHYVGYFKIIAEHTGISMRNIIHSSCVPFFNNVSEFVLKNEESCARFNQAVKSELDSYDLVVIGGNWQANFSRGERFEEELRNTIDHLSKSVDSVVIAKKIPTFPRYDRQCAQKAIKIPLMNCSDRSMTINNGDHIANEVIEDIANEYENVTTFSIRDYICHHNTCAAFLNGFPVYYDGGHLSLLGSEALGKKAVSENAIPISFLRLTHSDI